jgi:hypothetical protein
VASSLELASRLVIIHPPILPPLELGRMTTDHEPSVGVVGDRQYHYAVSGARRG